MNKIVGLIKTRNNGQLLINCLDHAFRICDSVVILDDCSDDTETKKLWKILPKMYSRLIMLENTEWESGFREPLETKHRQKLLDTARKLYGDNIWLYYFDADECIVNPVLLRMFIHRNWDKIEGINIRLFDSHATEDDKEDYVSQPLINFRKWYDPKYRDILMLWRNEDDANFVGIDKREPEVKGNIVLKGFCQHHGKALSEKLWEEKCDYYAKHFSERYKTKWLDRKGKYIHTVSDFGDPLETWDNLMNKYG